MIGVIADDLTGAAELAAVGWRHGLTAEIIFSGKPTGEAELVCVDTGSRSLAPAKAAKKAAAAARMLKRAGANMIFKKTDSVLRGPVVAELEAIMKELDVARTLFLPANPSLGRTIENGSYFLHGKPLNRTDFACDPEYPRHSANVLRLLGRAKTFPVQVLARGSAIPSRGISVGEVSTLGHIHEWIQKHEVDTLLAGGAETFSSYICALRQGDDVTKPPAERIPSPRELFVCGSASKACREFIAKAKNCGIPILSLSRESARRGKLSADDDLILKKAIALLKTQSQIILTSTLLSITNRDAPHRLSELLASLAARVVRGVKVTHVYAEGGETAAALVRQMQWPRLKVKRELALGVATLETSGQMLLTVKPGSYTWPAAILRKRRPVR